MHSNWNLQSLFRTSSIFNTFLLKPFATVHWSILKQKHSIHRFQSKQIIKNTNSHFLLPVAKPYTKKKNCIKTAMLRLTWFWCDVIRSQRQQQQQITNMTARAELIKRIIMLFVSLLLLFGVEQRLNLLILLLSFSIFFYSYQRQIEQGRENIATKKSRKKRVDHKNIDIHNSTTAKTAWAANNY